MNIYKTIEREYEQKRNNALKECEQNKITLYLQNPKLTEIDKEIRRLGLEASKLSIREKGIDTSKKIAQMLEQIETLRKQKNEIISNSSFSVSPTYECPKCHDTGYITTNYTSVMCSCMKQKLINISYNNSNLNSLQRDNFKNFKLDLFSDESNIQRFGTVTSPRENMMAVKNLADKFITNFKDPTTKNLLFVGTPGTGKTYMSTCIANELINNGYTVLYQTAPILMDKIFEYKYNSNDATSKEFYKSLFNVNLLIIDDLGTESQSAAKFAELFSIINSRLITPNVKTIISSNLDLPKLSKTYDDRIMSRFVGNYSICKFYGDDIRLKLRNN